MRQFNKLSTDHVEQYLRYSTPRTPVLNKFREKHSNIFELYYSTVVANPNPAGGGCTTLYSLEPRRWGVRHLAFKMAAGQDGVAMVKVPAALVTGLVAMDM